MMRFQLYVDPDSRQWVRPLGDYKTF
jgi:hypothetical protein